MGSALNRVELAVTWLMVKTPNVQMKDIFRNHKNEPLRLFWIFNFKLKRTLLLTPLRTKSETFFMTTLHI